MQKDCFSRDQVTVLLFGTSILILQFYVLLRPRSSRYCNQPLLANLVGNMAFTMFALVRKPPLNFTTYLCCCRWAAWYPPCCSLVRDSSACFKGRAEGQMLSPQSEAGLWVLLASRLTY
ncbi:Transmembrame protein 274 [Apodemus speciosus]|uniref:Transmembrame protein 274 n=1 Tax=Apodemus speciosus TaxID=105296 RepID=A0ABQ0EQB9_APOSI